MYVAGWFTQLTEIKWGIKKYTADGLEVWSKEWSVSTVDDGAQAMAIDSNDNIYVTGYITNMSGDLDWWMKKYFPDGSEDVVNWDFGFDGGYGDDTSISIAVDSVDNIYIAGRIVNSSGNIDGMVRKYSTDGNFLWSRDFDHAGKTDRAYCLAVDSSDNIYVSGKITQANDDIDWVIKKYDSNGTEDTTSWNKTITNGTDDLAWGIATDSGGNVYVCGYLRYTDNEWAIIKFDLNGNELYRNVISNAGDDWCRSIVVDSMDYIYGIGGVFRSGQSSDWLIEKYVP